MIVKNSFHSLFFAAFALPFALSAATINVSTSSQLASAVAAANPGDLIVMANGNYSGFTMTRSGNSSAAITIQAATVGSAVINSGTIQLSGVSYVNLDGLKFTTSGGSKTVDGTSRAFAVLVVNANFCRITRCTFALSGEASGTGWVTLDANSQHNQVDHCAFGPNSVGGHSHYIFPAGSHSISGVTPPSDRTSWANGKGPYNPDMPRFTEIDHNYFHDMGSGDGETIVLGGAGVCGDYQGTMSTVEYNLFVNCNGDPEVVSVKSSTNTVRFNTVITSAGVFSLRSGNGSTINGNFFLCGGTGGGVKINEMHHRVYNNYIENTDTGNYPIMCENGTPYNSGSFSHGQVIDAEIEYNTVVNPGRQVLIGHDSTSPLPVTDSVFANNIISGSGTLYSESGGSTAPVNMTRSQNIVNGTKPSQSGFIAEDPAFTTVTENTRGLQKLSSGSPAIGAANASYFSYVTDDMDGQSRSSPDIGADEYSTGSISRTPLTTSNVGPASGGGIVTANFSLTASPASQTVTAGNGTTYTATASAQNGFSGAVNFTVSGLPSGATASFNPTSVTGSGSSTLTVNTTTSTAAGTYTLTITGTSGSLTHATTVSLTVNAPPPPDFSLSASPNSVSVTQGANGTSTITVNPVNGFSGSVSLSASGLPSGVTASFNPSSTTSASTLTLTATSTAATGTVTVTVTGTSGSLTHTTTISLTVNAVASPNFTLSASPNSVTVVQGANSTSTITVNPVNGFSGSVSLSASGLPSGVTAAFNPSSTATTSTLTLTASSSATTGTATVTVTGVNGSLTHTTTISLTVNAANSFAGIFKVQNVASGLVLNNQGSLTNGSIISQWTATTVSSNLDWTFIATSNGYFQIRSSKSGLDAVVQGASTANGAGIVQWSFGAAGNDQWKPTLNSDGTYTFFNLHSGLVLEDPASSTNKATQMDQWSSTGGSNQKWNLLKQ